MSGVVRTMLRSRPGLTESTPIDWYADPTDARFERALIFEPGFGLDPDESVKPSSQRYGRSAMRIRWLARGPRGAVQFLMSTGWTPEPAPRDPRYPALRDWAHTSPSAWDLGYHARVPQYEGAEQYGSQPCEYLGAPCWYDGSGLNAEPVLAALFDRGEAGVWDALYEMHDSLSIEGEATS